MLETFDRIAIIGSEKTTAEKRRASNVSTKFDPCMQYYDVLCLFLANRRHLLVNFIYKQFKSFWENKTRGEWFLLC